MPEESVKIQKSILRFLFMAKVDFCVKRYTLEKGESRKIGLFENNFAIKVCFDDFF